MSDCGVMCGGQSTNCRNWFSSSTMWVLGRWTQAWEQALLLVEPSRWPRSFLSTWGLWLLWIFGYACTPNTHQRLFVCGFPIQNSEAVEASETDYLQFLSLPWVLLLHPHSEKACTTVLGCPYEGFTVVLWQRNGNHKTLMHSWEDSFSILTAPTPQVQQFLPGFPCLVCSLFQKMRQWEQSIPHGMGDPGRTVTLALRWLCLLTLKVMPKAFGILLAMWLLVTRMGPGRDGVASWWGLQKSYDRHSGRGILYLYLLLDLSEITMVTIATDLTHVALGWRVLRCRPEANIQCIPPWFSPGWFLLSLPPQPWDGRCSQLCLVFNTDAGIWTQVLRHVCVLRSTLSMETSSHPHGKPCSISSFLKF